MKNLIIILFMCFIANFTYSKDLHNKKDSPPVEKLRQLYSTDINFRIIVDKMFKNVHTLSDGSENPWRNKNIDDLYNFLNEWFYFLPNTHNGLEKIIKFTYLYYENPYGKKFILTEPGLTWSLYFIEQRGRYMDSPASTIAISNWLNDEALKNEDFEVPENGFKSFNEFFTREIKSGSRPIADINDTSIISSPADGIINMIENDLKLDSEIPTKGTMTLSLSKLLDASKYSEKFIGGTALAVFLMPENYHHYHSPVTGLIVESKEQVGDRLFGLPDMIDMINKGNPGYGKDYSVFQDFKHGYFIIETEKNGYVAMVPIGLQTIGSVVFEEKYKNLNKDTARNVNKGDKLGHFAYGGSTVLLIFEKNKLNAVTVEQGQRIGRFNQ
ncbi:MAG: phosphatidylserine decarboxylase [Gammaproteobacteria bacterium]|nr:phosphatidylserine decarboxylase [Gammaproteobacteria bacterium]